MAKVNTQVLFLRNVPNRIIALMEGKKKEILKQYPLRGHVSNTEAIVKLIEGR